MLTKSKWPPFKNRTQYWVFTTKTTEYKCLLSPPGHMFCCLYQEVEPRPKKECAWRLPRTYRVSSRTNGCLWRKRECFCFHCGQWVASSTHFTGNTFYLWPLSLWLERKRSWAKKYSLSFSKYHVMFCIKCNTFIALISRYCWLYTGSSLPVFLILFSLIPF